MMSRGLYFFQLTVRRESTGTRWVEFHAVPIQAYQSPSQALRSLIDDASKLFSSDFTLQVDRVSESEYRCGSREVQRV
jgi:hypothetical protein